MFVTVNGIRYHIQLRGSFSNIRSARKFEEILRRSYQARYGAEADRGKTIFEMDSLIGMISTSRRVKR